MIVTKNGRDIAVSASAWEQDRGPIDRPVRLILDLIFIIYYRILTLIAENSHSAHTLMGFASRFSDMEDAHPAGARLFIG